MSLKDFAIWSSLCSFCVIIVLLFETFLLGNYAGERTMYNKFLFREPLNTRILSSFRMIWSKLYWSRDVWSSIIIGLPYRHWLTTITETVAIKYTRVFILHKQWKVLMTACIVRFPLKKRYRMFCMWFSKQDILLPFLGIENLCINAKFAILAYFLLGWNFRFLLNKPSHFLNK